MKKNMTEVGADGAGMRSRFMKKSKLAPVRIEEVCKDCSAPCCSSSKMNVVLENRERGLVIADRFFPSTKTCSDCGFVNKAVILGVESWVCSACGVVHDRDYNAAINLSNLPRGSGNVKPVEMEALADHVGQ